MRTTFENGVLRNGEQLSVVEKLGFDSVEVMKTLSVRGNSPRDKRQFRAKATGVLEPILNYSC